MRLAIRNPFVPALVALAFLAVLGLFLLQLFYTGDSAEAASSLSVPSTKTPALKAAQHIDPNPAKGGGDIAIAGGMALVPESGPLGTNADIQSPRKTADQISVYVVREGDTLSQIAEMFGVTTNTVLWSNDLKSARDIHPGDRLVILPITGVQHVVAKGETVNSIVKKYQGDLEEVLAFNNLPDGATVSVGDTIIIPHGVEPAPVRTSTSRSVAHSSGGPSLAGYFLRPVSGGIKTQGVHGYNGVDIGVSNGTPVMASASGSVIIARSGWNGGYGNYIVIQHPNGTQTLYAHLSDVYVSSGSSVSQGDVIGASGNSGRSTGPHLHFETRGAPNPF